MNYNHNKKAGNPGDVIKHVALIAAVNKILEQMREENDWTKKTFLYCDTYAANALNLLKNGMEWNGGIGKIDLAWNPPNASPLSYWKNLWAYTQGGKDPNLSGVYAGIYPGSSYFVLSLLKKGNHKEYKLQLWDTSPDCIENQLEAHLDYNRNDGLHLNKQIKLFNKSAFNKNGLNPEFKNPIKNADFLFVDPPNTSLPNGYLKLAINRAKNKKWTMFWLPVTQITQNNQHKEAGTSSKQRIKYFKAAISTVVIQYGPLTGLAHQLLGSQIFLAGPWPEVGVCPVRSAVKNAITDILDAGTTVTKFFKTVPGHEDGKGLESYSNTQWGLPFGWQDPKNFAVYWPENQAHPGGQ